MTSTGRPIALTLYGRSWCHLCENMLHALQPLRQVFDFQVTLVDVDSAPELENRFGEWVPVLMMGDVELCHYHLDEPRVRTALAAASGIPPET
ncbi:glutaredoxin [Pandoraea thiooxydans]|uniref:Glutaredoxin n=1 Tax=Pandoraea thiooxydans TaxID=445709 RepID=A0A0G3ESF2_9BURK|nr:glutaredoxin family protein [Pandoraea thiooxydans]AKJ68939.1 glutaredoxin [Pandoraea thiooxydans]APR96459.1 glutaredoxin [Pandoraea thiooxydans]